MAVSRAFEALLHSAINLIWASDVIIQCLVVCILAIKLHPQIGTEEEILQARNYAADDFSTLCANIPSGWRG